MQSIFSENKFGGQTIVDNIHWIYAVLLMSVGPLGPIRANFSIIEDVVCKHIS